ncbi:hypothetical protein LCGC14_2581330, partial [marine sediment metagenome]
NPDISEYITGINKVEFIGKLHNLEPPSGGKPTPYKTLIYQYAGTSLIEYNRISKKGFKVNINESSYNSNFGPDIILLPKGRDTRTSKPDYYLKKFIKVVQENSSTSVLFIPYDTNYIKEIELKIKISIIIHWELEFKQD